MIERINNFRFPVSPQSTFDEEEITALDLSAHTAKKCNEVVDYLNNTLDGVITTNIRKKIDDTFINGVYNTETETLVLTIEFKEV